jgi:hypothetical protein
MSELAAANPFVPIHFDVVKADVEAYETNVRMQDTS